MKTKQLCALVLSVAFLIACGSGKTNIQKPEEWAKNAVIYEVNVRQYTPQGTFNAFANKMPKLKKLGVDILWFMPVHPISKANRKGTLGSYYAVQNYKEINPEFGTAEDFKNLVKKAHEMGFKVILDWVANHTGRDNVWIKQHPDWFVKDSLGAIATAYDWTDVAKLDYTNKDMRAAMIDAMCYWVKNFNVDGFRCDVAGEVPTDFWLDARAALDKIKPVFMLAEADKPELCDKAFLTDYNWSMLHTMNEIAKGKQTATDIDNYWAHHDSVYSPTSFKMNFITNHDENSWNGTEYERYGDGANTFAVLTYTLPGMPLIYSGQEMGMKKRLAFFEKDTISSSLWNNPAVFNFYTRLNALKHYQPALSAIGGGKMVRFPTKSNTVYVFARNLSDNEVLVALNLSSTPQQIRFIKAKPAGEYYDYFASTPTQPVEMQASSLDSTTLTPWQYKVLVKALH